MSQGCQSYGEEEGYVPKAPGQSDRTNIPNLDITEDKSRIFVDWSMPAVDHDT